MGGHANKKRSIDGRLQRPTKKQRLMHQYHSESENEEDKSFDAVDLLDSDDDIHNAKVDDVAGSDDGDASSSEEEQPKLKKAAKMKTKAKSVEAPAAPEAGSDNDDEDDNEEEDEDEDEDLDEYELDSDSESAVGKQKSKRNDPTAFATSLSKILSTKLSSSKRSDPVLSRSAAAHEASKAAVDNALESKAKRQLKEQKRRALEKGRVKDILIPANNETTGEPEVSTAEILAAEKVLRKVAQRGVVKLFNAVRAAQVTATEAERNVKKDGVIGMNRREEKVNELSKKGFLELIASGGGGLKKGALEEA